MKFPRKLLRLLLLVVLFAGVLWSTGYIFAPKISTIFPKFFGISSSSPQPSSNTTENIDNNTYITDIIGVVTIDGKTATDGMIIPPGAIVDATHKSSATIVFSDLSKLRLDANSAILVKRVPGKTLSKNIAQITVQKGRLWGRILTTDSMQFAQHGITMGVRGTSISLDYDLQEFWIIDTQYPTNAATFSYKNNPPIQHIPFTTQSIGKVLDISTIQTQTSPQIKKNYTIDTTGNIIHTQEIFENTHVDMHPYWLILDNEWVKTNTKKDIAYMNTLVHRNSSKRNILQKELDVTEPQNNDNAKTFALCGDGYIFWRGMEKIELMCQPKNTRAIIVCATGNCDLYISNTSAKDTTNMPSIVAKKIKFIPNTSGYGGYFETPIDMTHYILRISEIYEMVGGLSAIATSSNENTTTYSEIFSHNSKTIAGIGETRVNADKKSAKITAPGILYIGCEDATCQKEGYFPENFQLRIEEIAISQ